MLGIKASSTHLPIHTALAPGSCTEGRIRDGELSLQVSIRQESGLTLEDITSNSLCWLIVVDVCSRDLNLAVDSIDKNDFLEKKV